MPFWWTKQDRQRPFDLNFNILPLRIDDQFPTSFATIDLPGNAFFQLIHLEYAFSAAIIPSPNRNFIRATRGGRTLYEHNGDNAAFGASSVFWTTGINFQTRAATNARQTIPLPADFYLYPGDKIHFGIVEIPDTPSFTNIFCTLKEWPFDK